MTLKKKIHNDKFGVPHTFLPTAHHEKVYDKWIKGQRLTKSERAELPEIKQRKVNELVLYEKLKNR